MHAHFQHGWASTQPTNDSSAQLHQHNATSTRQHSTASTQSTKMCAITPRLITELRDRWNERAVRLDGAGICGNGSFRLLRNQSCARKMSLHQGCVLPRVHFCSLKEMMWVISAVGGLCGQGPWQCRTLTADRGQFIIRTAGHVRGCGTVGLAIVKGNHLCCCFHAFSGKRIPAPESNICCRYCNQMIPGNKYFHHVVSRN